MIKRLQRKFILIMTATIFAVTLLLVVCINAINVYTQNRKATDTLYILAQNNGKFPKQDKLNSLVTDDYLSTLFGEYDSSPERQFETRYFLVFADKNNRPTRANTSHIAAITSTTAEKVAADILSTDSSSGFFKHYKYLVYEKANEKVIVFLDCSLQIENILSFFKSSIFVAFGSIIVIVILVFILSKHTMAPFIESTAKQKQFVTDAGHEIKTPLTIIAANAEVIELNNGQSEWTDSIKHQVDRLSELVKNLLTLAKLDEEDIEYQMSDFCISQTIDDSINSFDVLFHSKHLSLTKNISPDIHMIGDENSIARLMIILLDNAIKYSDDHGDIRVDLSKYSRNIKLEVYNSCKDVSELNLNRLFDRFYRNESSRSRKSGGYGIGLSIASGIVNTHKGKIAAYKKDEGLLFTITLPLS